MTVTYDPARSQTEPWSVMLILGEGGPTRRLVCTSTRQAAEGDADLAAATLDTYLTHHP